MRRASPKGAAAVLAITVVVTMIHTMTIITHMHHIAGKYYTAAQRANCNYSTSSVVNIGVFYNDVWAYR